jgi:hypothetical protein
MFTPSFVKLHSRLHLRLLTYTCGKFLKLKPLGVKYRIRIFHCILKFSCNLF